VNQPTGNVEREKPQQPHYKQNKKHRQKHCRSPFSLTYKAIQPYCNLRAAQPQPDANSRPPAHPPVNCRRFFCAPNRRANAFGNFHRYDLRMKLDDVPGASKAESNADEEEAWLLASLTECQRSMLAASSALASPIHSVLYNSDTYRKLVEADATARVKYKAAGAALRGYRVAKNERLN
jgi:hypothetical protein